ncbi:MAG: OmpA family protein [Prevotella salivae]|mgnify:FL=1|jgi:putative immunoreactive antigen PG33|uniref:OmpA family protein n=2 Tax=Segatella salivae TaxID=228604 RepID=A0AAW4NSI4_9BACT|nr:OmpA family protein [Segatella salivae]EFV03851.1 OmpA family protein [Segatella salivae DSM 15606]MBF1523689.1 OmpA family protein [Segatella salivae]MBF1542259.1 OmpA family protein [Segatella salivae]MBF1546528.1 OmpA family protein [Segatella salivae]MBW4866645.1 OmpA family protein [Segatella salivae]
MKKFVIGAALLGMSMTAFAQQADPTMKYSVATNSFWSNWFIQVGGDYNIWYSNQEHGRRLDNGGDFDFLSKQRRSFGGSVAIGKWFTPGIGLRTKLQGFNSKKIGAVGVTSQHFWSLNEQIMFNLSNLFMGYNPERVWNISPFIGGGMARNMSANRYVMQLSAGINSSWRLCRNLDLYAEAGWNRMEDNFDGNEMAQLSNSHHGRGWEDKDNHLYAEIGLTFKLGKATWNKTPDVDAIKALSQSQIDALNSQLNDLNAENGKLRKELAEKPKTTVLTKSLKEFVATPISVFFNIGKIDVALLKDLVNVRALAKYAIENNSHILVTGYADSSTGTPAINQRLSEQRANTIVEELVKMGVNRSNIRTAAGGGVKMLEYPDYDRRATVQIVD